jgi:hypothetical protein
LSIMTLVLMRVVPVLALGMVTLPQRSAFLAAVENVG